MLSPPYSHAAQKDRAQLVAGTPMAPTPEGASLGGKGACDILRSLHHCGFDTTVVPASTSADAILALEPQALFLSNGPGDPAAGDAACREAEARAARICVVLLRALRPRAAA